MREAADDVEDFVDDAKNLEMQRPLPALITDRVAAVVVVAVTVDFFPPDVVTAATAAVVVDRAMGVGPGGAGCRSSSNEMTVAADWGALVAVAHDDGCAGAVITVVAPDAAAVTTAVEPSASPAGTIAIAFSGVMNVTS